MHTLILLLFVIGVWYFVGAVWAIVAAIPLFVVLPLIFINSVFTWWTSRHRRRAAGERRRAFRASLDASIRRHEEAFPESTDFDENGIPYL